jgi:hypothetical protein
VKNMPMTIASMLRRVPNVLVARCREWALLALGLAAAGCGPAAPDDSESPPPVETRELDASQTQRTMQPLDEP